MKSRLPVTVEHRRVTVTVTVDRPLTRMMMIMTLSWIRVTLAVSQRDWHWASDSESESDRQAHWQQRPAELSSSLNDSRAGSLRLELKAELRKLRPGLQRVQVQASSN